MFLYSFSRCLSLTLKTTIVYCLSTVVSSSSAVFRQSGVDVGAVVDSVSLHVTNCPCITEWLYIPYTLFMQHTFCLLPWLGFWLVPYCPRLVIPVLYTVVCCYRPHIHEGSDIRFRHAGWWYPPIWSASKSAGWLVASSMQPTEFPPPREPSINSSPWVVC